MLAGAKSCWHRNRPDRRRYVAPGENGLTLFEMLIVLVIIGVMAGGVALSVGAATRAPSVESEARGLALRLQAAADDAMIGDRTIAFTTSKHGYGFAAYGPTGALVPLSGGLAHHDVPGGISIEIDVATPVIMGVDGAGQPLNAVVRNGENAWVVRYDGMTASAAPMVAQ